MRKSKLIAADRPPVFGIALGRLRVGKTVLLNKAAEYFSALGISPQHSVKVDREHMATQMIEETLPLFADKLKHALVIRERTWNGKVRDRRWAMAAAVSLAVFLLGYSLSWWQDSGTLAAFNRCMTHPYSAAGQYYCRFDSTLLGVNYPPAPTPAQNPGG